MKKIENLFFHFWKIELVRCCPCLCACMYSKIEISRECVYAGEGERDSEKETERIIQREKETERIIQREKERDREERDREERNREERDREERDREEREREERDRKERDREERE